MNLPRSLGTRIALPSAHDIRYSRSRCELRSQQWESQPNNGCGLGCKYDNQPYFSSLFRTVPKQRSAFDLCFKFGAVAPLLPRVLPAKQQFIEPLPNGECLSCRGLPAAIWVRGFKKFTGKCFIYPSFV